MQKKQSLKITLDGIKPRGLEQQPSKTKVPKELDPVKPQKKPEMPKLNLSDRWNRFWSGIKQGYSDLMAVARSVDALKWIVGGLIVLAAIVVIIKVL